MLTGICLIAIMVELRTFSRSCKHLSAITISCDLCHLTWLHPLVDLVSFTGSVLECLCFDRQLGESWCANVFNLPALLVVHSKAGEFAGAGIVTGFCSMRE
jgi:hypothetical protein